MSRPGYCCDGRDAVWRIKKGEVLGKHNSAILNDQQRTMLNKLLGGSDGKLNTSKWAKITNTSQDTALRDRQDLMEKQIPVREVGGGRSTSYVLLNLN